MEDLKLWFIGAFAAINILVTNTFGAFTPLLWLTVGLMVFDLVTRIYAAGARKDEKVESKKVWTGLYRKLGMCFLIVASLAVDYGFIEIANNLGIQIATKVIFTALTLAWIFVRELISILENINHAGVELPGFIVKALNIAKDKVDQVGDGITKG